MQKLRWKTLDLGETDDQYWVGISSVVLDKMDSVSLYPSKGVGTRILGQRIKRSGIMIFTNILNVKGLWECHVWFANTTTGKKTLS